MNPYAEFPARARLALIDLERRVSRSQRRRDVIPMLLFDDLGAAAGVQDLALLKANNLSDLVDDATARLNLGLGTISVQDADDVAITGGAITGMPSPSNATDVATKQYVDSAATGVHWKTPVVAATTTAGTLASDFENGDTIDGVVLATGDRLLVKDQADAKENGIYVVAASGAPTRSTDADAGAELEGATVFVSGGTVNGGRAYICTSTSITIGVTDIDWVQIFSVGGALLASNNLSDVNSDVASRQNLGVEIGVDVQAHNAKLAAIAALANAAGALVNDGAGVFSYVVYLTPAGAAAAYQPLDADLTTFAAITVQAGDLLIGSAAPAWSRLAIGTAGRVFTSNGSAPSWNLLAGGNFATQNANFVFAGPTAGGAATATFRALVAADVPDVSATYLTVSAAAAGYQPLNSKLTSIAALANALGALTNDGAGAFSYVEYQPLDSDLTAIAALSTTAFGRGLLVLANAAALQTAAAMDAVINVSANYSVGGNQVVGARGAAVARPVGGTVVDVEARNAIDLLLSRLEAGTGHGLLDP